MNGHMGIDYLMAKHGYEIYLPDTFIMVDTSSIDRKITTKQMIKNRRSVTRMKRVVRGYHWLNEGYYAHTKNKDWVRIMLNKL